MGLAEGEVITLSIEMRTCFCFGERGTVDLRSDERRLEPEVSDCEEEFRWPRAREGRLLRSRSGEDGTGMGEVLGDGSESGE